MLTGEALHVKPVMYSSACANAHCEGHERKPYSVGPKSL